jgi:hypothetical protein
VKNRRRRQTKGAEEFLAWLEDLFERVRKPVNPPYPCNEKPNTIALPADLEQELRQLVVDGNKAEAVKRVTQLTGAGLRVSKDYVDGLVGHWHRHL